MSDFRPSFDIEKNDSTTLARLGRLKLQNGVVQTPVFMPVGTYGTVRGIAAHDLETTGSEIMLCNTYHLYAKVGLERMKEMGGLHQFNSWKKPILTDSGGFQVFSLAENRKITEDGVKFKNPRNGDLLNLTPEICIELQEAFGSDVMMVLDECAPAHSTFHQFEKAVELSTRWAKRALEFRSRPELALFCIIQGGCHLDLRRESLKQLLDLESSDRKWDGIAIGGLSVGEEKKLFVETLWSMKDILPPDRPHYLMGVGTPRDLVFAVACGVDMFDCVLPSRNGRHGIAMTQKGRLNLRNEVFKNDLSPLDRDCRCPTCARYNRAFLRHLFFIEDQLAGSLVTLHNLYYFLDLMKEIRAHIQNGTFCAFAEDFCQRPDQIFLGSEKGFLGYPPSLAQRGKTENFALNRC